MIDFTCFPYTKLNELNLDWLMEQLVALDQRVSALEEIVIGGGDGDA